MWRDLIACSRAWRSAVVRYLAALAVGSLAWEFAQMPLYTLWRTGSAWEVAFAALHCTAGDVLIAGASLAASLLLFGNAGWPRTRFTQVAAAAIAFGLGVTVLVEHIATAWGSWTYSELMPVLPGLGTGLAPLAQWVVVPLLAFAAMRLPLRREVRLGHAGQGRGPHTTGGATAGTAPDPLARSNRRAS